MKVQDKDDRMNIRTKSITENEMNSPLTNAKGSSPTKRLKNAIRKYPLVFEEVYEVRNGTKYGIDFYKCSLKRNGNLDRKKYKQLSQRSYKKDGTDVIRKAMENIDTHSHGSSDLEHKIWIAKTEEEAKAIKYMIEDDYSNTKEKFCDGGWDRVYRKYKKRVDVDLWDIEPSQITSKSFIDTWYLAKALFRIMKYAKKQKLDPESAMTALELEGNEAMEDLRDATSKEEDRKKMEIYKRARDASGSGGSIP